MKILLILLSFQLFASGNQRADIVTNKVKSTFDQSHKLLTEILEKNLVDGKVSSLFNYQAVKSNPKKLNDYLKSLESIMS